MDILFENAMILLDDSVIPCGYLGVRGKNISYIGAVCPQEEYAVRRNMTGKLLIPGFYNMHTHTPMTLLRGVGSGLPLDRWLNEAIFPVEAQLRDEDYSCGSRLAMMEMLSSGTVSFTDMYDGPEITAEEVLSAGMKANLCCFIVGFDPSAPYESNEKAMKSPEFFRRYNGRGDGRLRVDFSIHAEYTNFDSLAAAYAAECKKAGAGMHIHLSETRKEHEECRQRHGGLTPTQWFAEMGVLDNPTIAAHCVWVDDRDMEILKEKNVTCVHNPSSNMKLGSGFMPLRKLLDRGINVCIGTDGAASNNNLNMVEEIHLSSLIHNGFHMDPTYVRPAELIRMATLNGAAGQRRERAGALREGWAADIAAVDLDAPHLLPCLDVPALITYSMQSSDVVMTMADGQILYENGEFLTIDAEKTRADVLASAKRLFG